MRAVDCELLDLLCYILAINTGQLMKQLKANCHKVVIQL